MNFLNKSVY